MTMLKMKKRRQENKEGKRRWERKTNQ